MTMSTFDYIVVGIIIILGVYILYIPLKEPIDAIGRGIGRGIRWIADQFRGREVPSYEVIQYG